MLFPFERKGNVIMKTNVKTIAVVGIIAAAYAAMTVALGSLAYGNIQFRVAEALMLLCFYRKEYCAALTIGCFIANLFSPMALDMLFGTLATAVAAVPMYCIGRNAQSGRLAKMLIASLMPVISNALIVGAELKLSFGLPFWLSAGEVALGELVCVTGLGVFLFTIMEKNRYFMRAVAMK